MTRSVAIRPSTLRDMALWTEVGDRVFVRRYSFYDQNIGAILGDDGVLIVDTRISHRQADEILTDLRELTAFPVRAVVNTHGHNDHAFGNHRFRPAPIWGHERCARMVRETGDAQLARVAERLPAMADELAEVILDPPDRTFDGDFELLAFDAGGRRIELRHLGRGHTDNAVVVIVPDANVLFAGDLVEADAPPSFGDGYPLDWPATVERMVEFVTGAVVPGHGTVGDRAFAVRSMTELRTIAELATLVDRGVLGIDEAVLRTPYPAVEAREPLDRALWQLRGELD
ncbi:MAG TPA: MBL fold metallo-hydrolase [Candidatus Limnocylindrales bacterium]|nr:MBL fold metallo-hydrolase [Candidatus Limnocylindrales bacterium]